MKANKNGKTTDRLAQVGAMACSALLLLLVAPGAAANDPDPAGPIVDPLVSTVICPWKDGNGSSSYQYSYCATQGTWWTHQRGVLCETENRQWEDENTSYEKGKQSCAVAASFPNGHITVCVGYEKEWDYQEDKNASDDPESPPGDDYECSMPIAVSTVPIEGWP